MHRRLLGYVTDPVIRIKMQAILRLAAGGGKRVKWQTFTWLNQQAWFTLGCVASYHLQITPCLQGLLRRVMGFAMDVCCGLLSGGFRQIKKRLKSNATWLFLHASLPCMTQACECVSWFPCNGMIWSVNMNPSQLLNVRWKNQSKKLLYRDPPILQFRLFR